MRKVKYQLNSSKDNYKCASIQSSIAWHRSFLAPHIDTIFNYEDADKSVLNCIYFIDGNNNFPRFSGGTGIYKDNEFKEPIFIPNNLKNSMLIYSATDEFYHGFEKIKKGGFRKAVSIAFHKKDFLISKLQKTWSN